MGVLQAEAKSETPTRHSKILRFFSRPGTKSGPLCGGFPTKFQNIGRRGVRRPVNPLFGHQNPVRDGHETHLLQAGGLGLLFPSHPKPTRNPP